MSLQNAYWNVYLDSCDYFRAHEMANTSSRFGFHFLQVDTQSGLSGSYASYISVSVWHLHIVLIVVV